MNARKNRTTAAAATPAMIELTVADLRRPGEAARPLIERLIDLDRLLAGDAGTRVLVLVRREALAKAGGELRRRVAARAPAADERAALVELALPSGGRPPRCQPSLAHVLRAHMRSTLAEHDGRFGEAAKALCIADNTLRRRLGAA
ncbi:MAG: hypothetical protein H3C26_14490 [Rhodocyclaceae bacterium]|nr:hypothetical protein [Rhodocyclaceae bacterium]